MNNQKKGKTMLKQIKDIEYMFLFYGFLKSPISKATIKNLLLKGYTKEQIYEIGCTEYCY